MDKVCKAAVLHLMLGWLMLIHAFQTMLTNMMYAVTILNNRIIQDHSYTLDFHTKRKHLRELIYGSDNTCYNQIRMYRSTFDKLCGMLDTIGGLKPTKHMLVDEQVAMFLHILAHHMKNRVIQFEFGRSGETISRYFTIVLRAMMLIQGELFKTPEPIPEDSNDERWRWFKGCLGALDGTHIRVQVPLSIKARYRNRKGDVTTNVLGVCSPDGQFIFVYPGWEGSAADGRVLRDAIGGPNGFKVPQGNFYLVDAGYTNCKGFLAPYRGQRYHLSEWREGRHPQNPQECFNMRHSSARNIIERCFGMLKLRWAILRSPSFYPIPVQNRYIIACCLLHNLIMRDNLNDPLEAEYDAQDEPNIPMEFNPILTMEPSDEWSAFRDNLANEMFNAFRARRGNR